MRAPAVLIPFKGAEFKSRLSPVLGKAQRREFAYLLLADLLRTLRKAGLTRQSYVISSDLGARETVDRFGVSFMLEPKARGVNSAVRFGMGRLKGRDRFMVLPSDLAMVSVADLRLALALGRELSLVIAPSSSFNGTNLLLFPRRMERSLSYDNDSFWNHVAAAAGLGLRTAILTRRGLVFDVDTPADARALAESKTSSGAARYLRRLAK